MSQIIEGVILACTGVVDAGAFTLPDRSGFEMAWIAVVRGENLREQDIAQALMTPGLPPVTVMWIDEIPRTPSGEIDRDQLRMTTAKQMSEFVCGNAYRTTNSADY